MQALQTEDESPNHGRIIFATIGWTWKSRKADRKAVAEKQDHGGSWRGSWRGTRGGR
jgi:hypothetical protein